MPKMYESFSWIRDDLRYAGPIGNKAQFKGVALYPTISGNHRNYIAKELEASARTLVNKPVTLNHNSDVKLGNVRWAEHEDGRIEYVIELKDREYIQKLRDKAYLTAEEYFAKWGKQPVYGVSVEANYRFHDEECSESGVCAITPYGIIFNALSLVEDPEVPGVSGTTIELMEILHEQSYPEAQIVGLLLNDYSQWHNMPKRLAESYNHNVVNKLEEKTMKRKSKETTKKHKDIVAEASVSGDPRAQFLMEQQETPADTASHDCPEGEHWSEEEGKCVPNETATEQEDHDCPEGEHWDAEQQKCVPKASEQEGRCPEGEHKDEHGDCVPDQPPKAATPEFPATAPTVPVTPIPAVAEKHRLGEPFAGYEDFADCVAKNQDKDDPEAYCASIENKTEGETLRRLNKIEKDVKEIRKLLHERSNRTEVEEVKRKQRDKELADNIKSIKEQTQKQDFNIELTNRKLGVLERQMTTMTNIANKNFKNMEERQKHEAELNKRQCASIDELQNKNKQDQVFKKTVSDTLSGLYETQKHQSREIAGLKDSGTCITEQVGAHDKRLADHDAKVDIGQKAWTNLAKLNQAFEQDKATKLQETQKTTEVTKKKDEEIRKLREEVENLKSHVKPNFKASPKPPDAEPTPELIDKPYA